MPKLWSPTIGDVTGPVFNNIAATGDPGAGNDLTQNYSVGSLWINTTAGQLRVWTCISNTQANAQWALNGAAYGAGGSNPNTEVTQAGSSVALMAEEGNIYRAVGSGATLGGTAGDYVLGSYALPALFFDGP